MSKYGDVMYQSFDYGAFRDGRAVFALSSVWHLCREIAFSEKVSRFSLMPFPCSDQVDNGTCGGYIGSGCSIISLPVLSEYVDETATVINEIWAPMDDYPTQEALDDYYTSMIFFDPLDIKILRESMNNAEYMYAYSFEPLGDRLDRILNNV